ncbi:MAG: hypothetical protein AAGA93_20780 [Actinomycetota bacterium]
MTTPQAARTDQAVDWIERSRDATDNGRAALHNLAHAATHALHALEQHRSTITAIADEIARQSPHDPHNGTPRSVAATRTPNGATVRTGDETHATVDPVVAVLAVVANTIDPQRHHHATAPIVAIARGAHATGTCKLGPLDPSHESAR